MSLLKEKGQIINRINILKYKNEELKDLLKRYKNGDLTKEEAVKTGYIYEGEKLLFFKEGEEYRKLSNGIKDNNEKYPVDLEHLRILWVVISFIIVLFYISKRNK